MRSFFQLRQLRRVRRSLDDESVATLVHAFVTSCIDYCNGLLAGAPKVVTDKLQRVMNSAACIVTNTRKFDHGLTHVRHDTLHWLDVPERVMSAWNGAAVSVGDVPADLVRGWSSSPAFSWPWSTHNTSLQADQRWQKDIFLRWSVSHGTVFLHFWETKRYPWTFLSIVSTVFCLLHTDKAHERIGDF